MVYCKTKKGEIFKVYLDHSKERFMSVCGVDEDLHASDLQLKNIKYRQIISVSSSLPALRFEDAG